VGICDDHEGLMDRSLTQWHGAVVIAVLDGGFTLKGLPVSAGLLASRLEVHGGVLVHLPSTPPEVHLPPLREWSTRTG
jgi:hypothetical protein